MHGRPDVYGEHRGSEMSRAFTLPAWLIGSLHSLTTTLIPFGMHVRDAPSPLISLAIL